MNSASLRLTRFERVISFISPALATRRFRDRIALEEFERNYDAASRDRRLGNWRVSATGPNAEIERYGELIRQRARDLDQNNRSVRSAKLQFVGKTVGTGIMPRAVHTSERTRQAADDAWARFVDTCDPDGQQDYHGLQSLTASSMFIDGECLQLWLPDVDGHPNAEIKVLEADMLDERQRGISADRRSRVVGGIEFDSWNRRVAYHLHKAHPGETGNFGADLASERVSADSVDHYFHVARPGQIRGVSWLAPSIVSLRGADDVREAIIWRKRLEACLGLVIRSPDAQGAAPLVGAQRLDEKGRVEETMAPGKILRLGPGEDVTAFTPQPSGDAIEFQRSELYAFCASIGIAYHEVTGDASQANYSSMRAARIAGDILIDIVQWLILAPRIKAAWRRVMRREYSLTGRREFLDVKCELAMPFRPLVDPLKDITAKILEVRAGLQSMPDAIGERGINWQKHVAEIEKWVSATEALGLVFDTDPRHVDRAGALQQLHNAAGAAGEQPQRARRDSAAPFSLVSAPALSRELRFASARSYNAEQRTVEGVFATGAPVPRFGMVETLSMDQAAVDLSRVRMGQCKALDSHKTGALDAIIGSVEFARIESGALLGRIRFTDTEAGRAAEGMVERGELTGFSIGYSVQRWTHVGADENGGEEWRADRWTLLEVTLCAVPADGAAMVL